ncbi:MAG: 3-oxoacyl-ACP reductase FabG [Oleiphilaceae bacterium]|nr:3-oxoacyl-ACP reductase FabG [Oleiphilaceae bacterium]
MDDLKGKVVVVSGAGKGIGFETVLRFLELGCKVAAITRTEADLLNLSASAGENSKHLFTFYGDVSSVDEVNAFADAVFEKYGQIDVLINNAGMRFRKPFIEIAYDEWRNVMDVNLGSTFLMCQAFGKHMLKQRSGRIINMASIVGTLGLPELSGYAASKGGIISLTKSLALEWAEFGINVNVVAPGFCETSYTDNFKKMTDLYQFTLDRTPKGRWGQSKDIANACVYLASSLSNYVTGEVLNVDGGWSAW